MAATNVAQKALGLINAFERAGRTVSRVTVDGRKIAFDLSPSSDKDEFESIDMRHDKT